MSDDDQTIPDAVPKRVRTIAYAVGTVLLVFATSVGDALPDLPSRIVTGLGAAALALAFGYRPTR